MTCSFKNSRGYGHRTPLLIKKYLHDWIFSNKSDPGLKLHTQKKITLHLYIFSFTVPNVLQEGKLMVLNIWTFVGWCVKFNITSTNKGLLLLNYLPSCYCLGSISLLVVSTLQAADPLFCTTHCCSVQRSAPSAALQSLSSADSAGMELCAHSLSKTDVTRVPPAQERVYV